jgi:hypothetical protein
MAAGKQVKWRGRGRGGGDAKMKKKKEIAASSPEDIDQGNSQGRAAN